MFLVMLNRAAEILGTSNIAALRNSAERYGCLHHSFGIDWNVVDRFVAHLGAEERSEVNKESQCANDANP